LSHYLNSKDHTAIPNQNTTLASLKGESEQWKKDGDI